jgi:hypothetical protein
MQFVPLILAAGAGTASAIQTRNVGVAQSNELEFQARQESDQARGREIERRRRLLRALASQHAEAAAGGVAFTGSQAAIARRDIEDATNDLLIDQANAGNRIAALRARARTARQMGRSGAFVSLLDTAAKAVDLFPGD